jgi:hypothetical protein
LNNYIANLIDNYENGFNLYKIISIPDGNDCGTIIASTKEEAIAKWENIENSSIPYKNNKNYDLTDDGTGKKYDTGKPMVGTLCRIFPRALLAIGKCIEFGTHKYPAVDNWKLVDNAFTRYQDAMQRHYLKYLAGEERDPETNLLHLAHMGWNALAILELYLSEHKEDYDRELFI